MMDQKKIPEENLPTTATEIPRKMVVVGCSTDQHRLDRKTRETPPKPRRQKNFREEQLATLL